MKFKINLSILFFLAFFYITHNLKLYIIFLIFAFLHECSHIFVGFLLGFKVSKVELMPFGFFCNLEADIEDYNTKILNSNKAELKRIFVILAGPFMNIILALLFQGSNILVYINLVIFLFNLIPIMPLDGGQFIKSFLKLLVGFKKANYYIHNISTYTIIFLTFLTSLFVLYFHNFFIVLTLVYIWYLSFMENKKYKILKLGDMLD